MEATTNTVIVHLGQTKQQGQYTVLVEPWGAVNEDCFKVTITRVGKAFVRRKRQNPVDDGGRKSVG